MNPTPDDQNGPATYVNQTLAAKVALEKGLAHCIRQMMAAIDGFIALAFLDDTTRMKSPSQHKLDLLGGVDGMRVTFRGQAEHVLQTAPMSRHSLTDRHKVALRVCEEHIKRSAEFGNWLTEKSAPAANLECIYALSALHLVLKPYSTRIRHEILSAYMTGRDPADAAPLKGA